MARALSALLLVASLAGCDGGTIAELRYDATPRPKAEEIDGLFVAVRRALPPVEWECFAPVRDGFACIARPTSSQPYQVRLRVEREEPGYHISLMAMHEPSRSRKPYVCGPARLVAEELRRTFGADAVRYVVDSSHACRPGEP